MSAQNDARQPVTVFRSGDPGLLALAQSWLEAAEIDFFVVGGAVAGLYPAPASHFGVPEICVAAEDLEAAQALVHELE